MFAFLDHIPLIFNPVKYKILKGCLFQFYNCKLFRIILNFTYEFLIKIFSLNLSASNQIMYKKGSFYFQ
ncbi:MAG: hypothetical protein COC22_00650 [Flavobacteriaceae bacterium]|nr:MAG: hypothetical protein COC22_00650 [Flavobacteriaceae bacterium]